MYFTFKKPIINKEKGFSLVELIVVVAIFLIITVAILFNQSKFSSDVLITNQAYQVALSLREAQTYGIGSRTVASNTRVGYGAHFDAGDTEGYFFFTDRQGQADSDKYVYSSADEAVIPIIPITLTEGQTIQRFCVRVDITDPWNCSDGIAPGSNSITEMDIVFVKPNPVSHILVDGVTTTKYNEAVIVVASSIGDKCRTVRITKLGQISVDPTDPTDPENGCGEYGD